MQYIQVTFTFEKIEAYQQDLLIHELGEKGYNTFEETTNGFAAFVEYKDYSQANLAEVLSEFQDEIVYTYTVAEVEAQNWNEEWEKNFEPLIISEQCYVRATFHPAQPKYLYEVVIDPKMAFGTGHHQTTTMMMQYILSFDFQDKIVLDMGCGTGILAILAAKRGAKQLVAIDYDEVCYESTLENTALNKVNNIKALCGGKEVIIEMTFDVILANINRNILLDQIAVYATVLQQGGSIFFSGFYESPDLEMIKEECLKYGILYEDHQKMDDWVAAHFIKN